MQAYDVYDADAVQLGTLSLAFDYMGAEGRGGRLVLGDGRSLEIEWFCLFEEGDIGVSLFSRRGQEAWLEGDVHHDERAIVNAALELWGAKGPTMTEKTAPVVDTHVPPAVDLQDVLSPYAQVLAGGLGGTFERWAQSGIVSLLPQ
jgi:hypothetical protein